MTQHFGARRVWLDAGADKMGERMKSVGTRRARRGGFRCPGLGVRDYLTTWPRISPAGLAAV